MISVHWVFWNQNKRRKEVGEGRWRKEGRNRGREGRRQGGKKKKSAVTMAQDNSTWSMLVRVITSLINAIKMLWKQSNKIQCTYCPCSLFSSQYSTKQWLLNWSHWQTDQFLSGNVRTVSYHQPVCRASPEGLTHGRGSNWPLGL